MPNETVPIDSALNFLFGTYGNGGRGSLRPPGFARPRAPCAHSLGPHWNPMLFPNGTTLIGLRSILIPAL